MGIARLVLRLFFHYDPVTRRVFVRPAGWLALATLLLLLVSGLAFGGSNLVRAFALRAAPVQTPEPTAVPPTVPPRLEVSSSGEVVQVPLEEDVRNLLLEAFLRAWGWMYSGTSVLPHPEGLGYFAPLPEGSADPHFQPCGERGWCWDYRKVERRLRACEAGRCVLFEESDPRAGWHLRGVYLLPSGDRAVLELLRDPVWVKGRDLRTGEVREMMNSPFRYVVSLVRADDGVWRVARMVRY